MKEMTIKELADCLQVKIDTQMETFVKYHEKVKNLTTEIEKLEIKMFNIITVLEPVESLIYAQSPELRRIFESLQAVYGREENGTDREVN
jgi:hypothetical protein